MEKASVVPGDEDAEGHRFQRSDFCVVVVAVAGNPVCAPG